MLWILVVVGLAAAPVARAQEGPFERAFLEGKQNVRRLGNHALVIARDQVPSTVQVVVMNYE